MDVPKETILKFSKIGDKDLSRYKKNIDERYSKFNILESDFYKKVEKAYAKNLESIVNQELDKRVNNVGEVRNKEVPCSKTLLYFILMNLFNSGASSSFVIYPLS